MPLDDRIRQLTETIIHEVRSPIEAALHNLLRDVMTMAAEDRDRAVQEAVAAAAAGHEASLSALREHADQDRVDVDALRAQFEQDRDASLAALREDLEREHGGKLSALRDELTLGHDTTLAGLREELNREHEAAASAFREQLTRERDDAVAGLRSQLEQDHAAATAALREDHAREREAALASLRDELSQGHEAAIKAARDEAALDLLAQMDEQDARAAADREMSLAGLREELTRQHEADLAAVRDELAHQHDAALSASREDLTGEHEAALSASREELAREHEAALAASREELARQHEAALDAQRDTLAAERESAVAAAREEADRNHQARIEEHQARADSEREAALVGLREELGRQHATALQAVQEELGHAADPSSGTARAAAEVAGGVAFAAALAQAERARHEADTRAAALEHELEQAQAAAAQAEQAMRDAGQAREQADQARQQAEQAKEQLEHARQEAEQAREQAEQKREAAEQQQEAAEQHARLTHVADRQQELECSDRTLTAFRRMDEARSLTEILRILADQAATEAGRVAVLLVIGPRLRGWEFRGLPAADADIVDVAVDPETVFGQAIARNLPVSTSDSPLGPDGDRLASLLAAPPDRAGLAVPISVGGRVAAILYADDVGDRTPVVPSNWPEIAEILARHAGHCLEVLTISHASFLAGRVQDEQAAPANRRSDPSPFADQRREEESARRYARLLISEIKLYNESAVEQGRAERNLVGRLGPEIERARRLYEEKIPAAVRQRVDCFDREVVRTLAGGDPGPVGADVRVIQNNRFLRRHTGALLIVGLVLGASAGIEGQRASDSGTAPRPVPSALTASVRPRLPADISQPWLVPERPAPLPAPKPVADFAAGMRLFGQAKYAEALPLLNSQGLAETPLAAYASFYAGVCSLNLARAAEARTAFARLHGLQVPGFIAEAAISREAEAAAAQGDHAAAAKLYDELARLKTAAPDAILLSLGRELQAAGDRARAAESFARLYYEFPLSDLAAVAATELDGLRDLQAPKESNARFKLDLGRAERLFGFKRYQQAKQALEALEPIATGDDAEVVAIRIAECDHYLRRFRQAREKLAPYLDRASRKAEAEFFALTATRELGDQDEYVRLALALVAEFPDSSWAEETLNNLATHYILADDDEQADATFRELYAKFPQGVHAERAAWKAGWWAYKHGRYHETVAFYESAASTFPRSDYRPAFIYWSARSREQMGDKQGAATVYRIVTTDYLNTYYGRLASKRLQASGVRLASNAPEAPAPPAPALVVPPTADLIRLLLSLELYDQARDELLYAQRTWGDTPVVNATLGWVYNRQGDLRRGIIQMKRAYPQYMSDEGSRLPVEILKVVFPIDYWSLIRKYAPAYNLDPYLVAALINQESAFDADIKSAANAVGLMQVLPSTGKQYARTLHLRRYSSALLTRPEINIQLGMAYFSELVRRFGGVQFALASYNAGEHRVYEWNADRPGLEVDEYIDDIPFPETQTYVKRIIGTAEDYRRLYAGDAGDKAAVKPATASKAKAPAPPKKKPAPPKKTVSK